jgi:hypothetical protein
MTADFIELIERKTRNKLNGCNKMTYKNLILAFLIIGLLCFNASAGCGKWVPRATDYLQDPLMDMNDPASNEPSSEASAGQTAGTNIQSQPAAPNVNAAPKPDLSGKWSFKLGTNNVSSEMILIQSASWADDGNDRIQGYGSLFENNLITPLTATGSLSNDNLELELRPSAGNGDSKSNKKYVLQMALGQKDLSGTYEIISSDVLDGKGNATATRLEVPGRDKTLERTAG